MADGFARELWRRVEALHAVSYFAPESIEAAQGIGLRGFWRMYFAFRAAPLGATSAGVVTAAFFGFAPRMVERAIPDVWTMTDPDDALAARSSSAAATLRRLAGDDIERLADHAWAGDALGTAIAAAPAGALPLFLANRDLSATNDPVAALWQATTTLREQRGDGHVALWTARGFSPTDVAVRFVAAGGTTRDALQPHRGWTDEEWDDAVDRAVVSGHLAADGTITDAGRTVVDAVEAETDRLAAAPFHALDAADRDRLIDALTPAARSVTRSGLIPSVNPMGVALVGDDPASA
ncbi:MAG: hypothetical protein AAGE98_00530 [Actinomycetota bacterium]